MSSRSPSRHAVTFVFITVFLDMVGFGLVMPVLPRLIEAVSGADLADASLLAGWLIFAYGGMQFLCEPVLGNLSDAYGRRPILLLSVFGFAVDYLLTAFAPNMLWLFVGRTFAGLCGASYTTANAYLADITKPEERAKVFGYMGAAFGLGFIIGPAIGGILGEYGPRVPFFVAAGVSILNFAYGFFVLPETVPREMRRPFSLARSNPIGVFKVFSTYKQVLPLCIIMAMYFFATSVYPAIWAFWGIARFDWSESTIGLTLAIFGLITAIVQGGLDRPHGEMAGRKKHGTSGVYIIRHCGGWLWFGLWTAYGSHSVYHSCARRFRSARANGTHVKGCSAGRPGRIAGWNCQHLESCPARWHCNVRANLRLLFARRRTDTVAQRGLLHRSSALPAHLANLCPAASPQLGHTQA